MVNCSFDIVRGTRVQPRDEETARILGRGRHVPLAGTVVGHAGRAGDFLNVRWDDDNASAEDCVHWANLRPEGGEPYHPDLVAEG